MFQRKAGDFAGAILKIVSGWLGIVVAMESRRREPGTSIGDRTALRLERKLLRFVSIVLCAARGSRFEHLRDRIGVAARAFRQYGGFTGRTTLDGLR
jgi:hypothetical protein